MKLLERETLSERDCHVYATHCYQTVLCWKLW